MNPAGRAHAYPFMLQSVALSSLPLGLPALTSRLELVHKESLYAISHGVWVFRCHWSLLGVEKRAGHELLTTADRQELHLRLGPNSALRLHGIRCGTQFPVLMLLSLRSFRTL